MSKTISYVILWALIGLGVALGVMLTIPPEMPKALSLKQFSVEKERVHIAQMAQAPHPLGTSEHRQVQEYILSELQRLELTPIIQRERCTSSKEDGQARVAWVDNLMVRIPGQDNSGAILLMAHYDSVPDAPGANDDSAGVAAILEILRILTVSESGKNDIIALITDGEEIGMFGAQVFFERHPWAQDVGVVLNFEARGCAGVAFMYETGPDNAWLVREFARSASAPVGNSLTHAIYQMMPNDSDFTLAKSAGLAGLNFAYIDGWQAYHTPLDNLEHLDDNTLYHHGSGVLQLVNRLRDMPLDSQPPGDAVYFNLWRSWLISYPVTWTWPLTGLVLGLFGIMLLVGFWKKYLTPRGILLGFGGLALCCAAAFAISYLLEKALHAHFGDAYPIISQYPGFRHAFLLALFCVTIFLFLVFFSWARKWEDTPSLAAGSLIWWALGSVAAAQFLPQASFLTTWPLLLAVFSLGMILAFDEPDTVSGAQVFLMGILALPALIQLSMTFVAFNTAFRLMPLTILIPGLMLGLLIPALAAFREKALWITGILFLVAALGAAGYGLFGLPHDTRPLPQHVIYERDGGSAFLNVLERTAWAEGFLEDGQDRAFAAPSPLRGTTLGSPASRFDVAPPRVEFESVSRREGLAAVRIRVSSPRRAPLMGVLLASGEPFTLEIGPEGEKLFSASRGEQVSDAGKPHRMLLYLFALPVRGVQLLLETKGDGDVEVECVDLSYDLPQALEIPSLPSNLLLHPRTLAHSRAQLPGR
ncbi:MAG: M20/M25/M40 family metallo-hydrolase [Candidatus Aminicenantaceae bacterium]